MFEAGSTGRAVDSERDVRFRALASGVLLTSVGLPSTLAKHGEPWSSSFAAWSPLVGAALGALLLAAALTLQRHLALSRGLSIAGVLGTLVVLLPELSTSPFGTLSALVLSATAIALVMLGRGTPLESTDDERRIWSEGRARGAAGAALLLWLIWGVAGLERSAVNVLALAWALGSAVVLSLIWAIGQLTRQRKRALVVLWAIAVSAIAVLGIAVSDVVVSGAADLSWSRWTSLVNALLPVAVAGTLAVRPPPRQELNPSSGWETFVGHPERFLVGSFAGSCFLGTVLLALPQSSALTHGIGFTDAAFTSTSAVCVTGLAVLDTATAFSTFGKVVILLLIQVGGLGIMTFSTIAFGVLGHRMSLRHEGAVASLISSQDRGQLHRSAKRILGLTIICEGSGAVLLAVAFWAQGDAPGTAVWRGVFTAVSAFCNAGFALQSDSLIGYQTSPLVLHTVGLLIVLGGLSPVAVFALPNLLLRSAAPVSAQARLSLLAAALLLVGGFGWYLAFEWNLSLRGLSLWERVHNAWFQSVTLRTAGFNSVDVTQIGPATVVLMLVWMFIGGSPGGTAGGVKTTTIAVLLLAVVQTVRGQRTIQLFRRRVPEQTVERATVVVTVAASSGLMALLAILLTQNMPARLAVFEVVSALGTVGLSLGGTSALDGIGKAVIVLCMFVGRVGGLTLLLFLSTRRAYPELGRPEEHVDVG